MNPRAMTWTVCLLVAAQAATVRAGTPRARDAFGSHRLSVVTINAQQLPGILGSADSPRNLRVLLDVIRKGSWDVVAVQEMFDDQARRWLGRQLRSRYPHQILSCGGEGSLAQDSGLCVFSRRPLMGLWEGRKSVFRKFDTTGDGSVDGLADKGILGVAVDLCGIRPGRVVWVFVTHLQSDPDEVGEYARERVQQLRTASGVIASCMRLGAFRKWKQSAVLVGDLNVPGETRDARTGKLRPSAELRKVLERLGGARDAYRDCNPGDPGYTYDETDNPLASWTGSTRLRLDYIVTLPGLAPLEARSARVVKVRAGGRWGTDHHGVAATFDVR